MMAAEVADGPSTPAPEGSDGAFIRVGGVSKRFRHRGTVVDALADVDLEVAEGEFVSLIGPSGCGKSTLLRVIGDLVRPDSGTVRIGDTTATEARAAKQFGLVPQAPALLPWRTVRQNVTLLDEVNHRAAGDGNGAIPAAAADELLDAVGLGDFSSSHPAQLSGGMQQRVALVRAFVLGAPILLMDEPFTALDEMTRNAMRYQLLDIWERARTTVVFVTHSIAEAVILSDTVVVMAARPGRIVAVERIGLPRPRREELEDGPEFLAHVRRVKDALRVAWTT